MPTWLQILLASAEFGPNVLYSCPLWCGDMQLRDRRVRHLHPRQAHGVVMKRLLLPAAALLALGGWFYYTHAPVDARKSFG